MSLTVAITCDRSNCLAFLHGPAQEQIVATLESLTASFAHDWSAYLAFHQGQGPALELGECWWCGRQVATRHGLQELCMSCALAAAFGWTFLENGEDDGHACPPCAQGAGPVLERGECARCGGRVTTRHGTELCMYCGHLTPDNGPEWHREGWTDGEDQDVMPTGPGEWAGAGGEEDQDQADGTETDR